MYDRHTTLDPCRSVATADGPSLADTGSAGEEVGSPHQQVHGLSRPDNASD